MQKARQSGAPIDGVVVSAGIPELEEAVELIDELNTVGISHVVFKPGTVEQIRSVIRIAAEVPDQAGHRPHRGRPRRWPPLLGGPRRPAADHLLRAAQAAPTSRSASAAASARPSGPPSTCPAGGRQTYGFPLMPVDGILVGTAAMAAWRPPPRPRSSSCWSTPPAPTSGSAPEKRMTAWHPGAASSAPTSTRSTTPPRVAAGCSTRSPATPTPSPSAATRSSPRWRDTAKPYFGDVGDMTYLQWLQRYVELAIGDGDCTADTKAADSPWLDDHLARPLRRDAEARRGPPARRRLRPDRHAVRRVLTRRRVAAGEPRAGHRRAAGPLSRRRDGHAASRRRAVLRPAVQDAGQAGELRAGHRQGRAPLVAQRLAVAGPRRPLHRRPGVHHPRHRRPSPASPASTSRSASCSTASSRPRSTRCWPPVPQPVAGGIPAPGPHRRHRPAGRRARLARRAVGRSHRDQPGAPHRARPVRRGRSTQRPGITSATNPFHRCAPGGDRSRPGRAERPAVGHLDRHPLHVARHARSTAAAPVVTRRGRGDRDARRAGHRRRASTVPMRCRRWSTAPPPSPSSGIRSGSPTTPVSPRRSERPWRQRFPLSPTLWSAAAGPRCSRPSARRSPTPASRSSRAC